MIGVHERVSALAEVVLRQIRGEVRLLAEEDYGDKFTAALQAEGRLRPAPDPGIAGFRGGGPDLTAADAPSGPRNVDVAEADMRGQLTAPTHLRTA